MVYVLKIGGSLLNYPADLRNLCKTIESISMEYDLALVPGGGVFADTVRDVYSNLSIREEVAHDMAVLAMDQYGLLLNSFIKSSRLAQGLENVSECFKDRKTAIIVASNIMSGNSNLPRTWDITSDSIAAYVAQRLDANALLLVKVVDGLRDGISKSVLKSVKLNELDEYTDDKCVDRHISKILSKKPLKCFIVNGRFPNRIEDVLRGREAVYTEVVQS